MKQEKISCERQTSRAAHSQVLDLLRFPLALVVLTVHVFGVRETYVYGQQYVFQGQPLIDAAYYFVRSFLSEYSLTIYFFISGYVFFLGVNDFSPSVYKRKLRNRIKTLLIPYIVWNIVAVLVELSYFFPPLSALRPGLDINDVDFSFSAILQTFGNSTYGVFGHVYSDAVSSTTVFYPQDSPLWFLRALMAVTLITPALHFFLRKFGLYFVGLTYVMWGCVYVAVAGLTIEFFTALFPFSFGACMSIRGHDMMTEFGRYFKLSAVLYLLLSAVQMVELYNDADTLYLATKVLAAPVAMVFAYNVSAWLLRKGVCHVVPSLAAASFFIYITHYMLVGNTMKMLIYVFHPDGQGGLLVIFIAAVVLICGLLLVLFYLMRRFTPRLLKFTTGRR